MVGLACFFVIGSAPSGSAQRIFGDILGNVTDASGAAVPGANVTLRNQDTGRELTMVTDEAGSYLFVELEPGRYEVRVERQGFEKKAISNVKLSADQRARVDVALPVGSVTTVVEVNAGGGQLVQTETSNLSEGVENRRVEELPVNGRSYLHLAITTPGVIVGGSQGIISNTSHFLLRNNLSIWVSGQRESSTNYLIDGIESRDNRFAAVSFRPSIDMINEFKIERNAYGGEIGIDGGTVVNITTKGGSNDFHGDAYEFVQTTDFNARNFFDKVRPPSHHNVFGAVFGGPIKKNKVFFFGSYEGERSLLAQTLQGFFPSPAQFEGNLADNSAGTGIFPTSSAFCQSNPSSNQCKDIIDPSTGLAFPGNSIPGTMISTFAKNFAQFLPAANAVDRLPLGINRLVNPPISTDRNQWSARVDYNVSSRDTVFARFIWANEPYFLPGISPGAGENVPLQGRNLAAGWIRTITPNLVNTLHAGFNKGAWIATAEFNDPTSGAKTNFAQVLGLHNVQGDKMEWSVPSVSLVGFTGLGNGGDARDEDMDRNYQASDTLDYIRGRHDIRIGGAYRREKYFGESGDGTASFTFQGAYTGSSIGDYLLGLPTAATDVLGVGSGNFNMNLYAVYASDTYKIRPDLTLNFGLGWEYKSPLAEVNNRDGFFNFQTLKYEIGGTDFKGSPIDAFYGSWKPQLGFAWRPFGAKNTVIRSGAGIYWESQKANDFEGLYYNPPYLFIENMTSGATPSLFTDQLFPQFTPTPPFGTDVMLDTRAPHEKRPYSPEWNLSIQHQFAQNWLAQVSYEGASFVRGGSFNEANPGSVDPTGTIPLQQRRLYPQFGDIILTTTMNHGNYNGGTAVLRKRFSNGLTLDMNYTYAHSVDNGTNEINNADFPLIGRRGEKGAADIDIRHRYIASYIYELPVGRGKRFMNTGGVPNAILGGWQVSGITLFQTGTPDKVVMPGSWMNDGAKISARPNCVADPNSPSIRGGVRSNGLLYFNTAAYQPPPRYTPGNCGRNNLRSPGVNNWDTSVEKVNRITERVSLETRFEFFDVWNHAEWQIFSNRSGGTYTYGRPGLGNASFGHITSARDPRIIQIAMKLIF